MIKSGTRPNKHDGRDYSFFKTKKLGGTYYFPDFYSTEAGLWTPNQNDGTDLFVPRVPSMPWGCTNYSQSDLLVDEDKRLYNPMDLENITHANANGGAQLRDSLKAVVKLHPDHPAFFNVQPDLRDGGYLDWFDSVRVAIILGKTEGRAVSVGTPWFYDFLSTNNGVIKPFLNWAINGVSWHNWVVKGWKTIDGKPYLIGKPWLGPTYGDGGFCYMDRVTFNRLMSIPGTVAFILDKLLPNENPKKIDSTVAQWVTALFAKIIGVWK